MKDPCEHCGNADKSKWQTQCLYKGNYPSRRAFILSTFDAPCSCDAFDEGQAELSKSRFLFWWLVALIGIPALIHFFS